MPLVRSEVLLIFLVAVMSVKVQSKDDILLNVPLEARRYELWRNRTIMQVRFISQGCLAPSFKDHHDKQQGRQAKQRELGSRMVTFLSRAFRIHTSNRSWAR